MCSFQQCGIFIFFFQSPLITLCVYTFTESACNAGRTGDVGLVSGSEDPLEEKMATHSSILPWRIPWTESGGLQSMGLQRVGRDWVTEHERERHFYWIYCNSQVFEHKDYGVWWSYLGILSSYMCSLLLIFFMQGGILHKFFHFFFMVSKMGITELHLWIFSVSQLWISIRNITQKKVHTVLS